VGGTKAIPINVRVIAATNMNLEKAIANGIFREDLYYRLNRMPIHIPPLRLRKEDIPLLCERLIRKINQDYGRNVRGVSQLANKKLSEYDWPGNVRELENVLGRAIIFMNYNEILIEAEHLPDLANSHSSGRNIGLAKVEVDESESLANQLAQHEAVIIKDTLNRMEGNKTQTAKVLGISVRSLYYKLEKLGLEVDGMQ
jgi:transcriptional regulator with PAS, ATPase and Fis domain